MKTWSLPESAPPEFLGGTPLPSTVANLLWNRGLREPGAIEPFLHPEYAAIPDPFAFNHMARAVERIRDAVKKGERIVVYGDYDIDGMTATAILSDVLGRLSANVETYIPSRFEEGYGLNKEALTKLAGNGAAVVITVDSGIVAFEEAAHASTLALDLIITDHHLPGTELPEAHAIIHPKLPGEGYPYKDLSGAGVAFKLASALILASQRAGESIFPSGSEKWLLDLAAMGTVSDIVPLTGENRLLTYFGLIVLNKTKRPGLQALIEAAAIKEGAIDTRTIGFGLSPRLNASGRLTHAQLSLDLLTATDRNVATPIAQKLNELNSERAQLTKEIFESARARAAADPEAPLIFIFDKEWSHGVVGIAAARLVEEFGKPVLIGQEVEGAVKGSARSIPGFDLVEVMRQAKGWTRFGGHKMAAGFTFPVEAFEQIKSALFLASEQALLTAGPLLTRTDGVLSLADIDLELLDCLKQLAPFGEGNPEPLFIVRGKLMNPRPVGDGSHLRFALSDGMRTIPVIGFGLAASAAELAAGSAVECLATLTLNEWNGSRTAELQAKSLRRWYN